ncbi:peptide deformylase [Candidatus Endolissoclinum faulkneri L2]|uniref:Peptide deformylase n=1 Tax=Candidatus Endolissoclinum faulkneri L2 TaxID=1193729 RepID=K7YPQ0_9PROT|nr:peptide deformylase [Candidatus Endolissoclinum faulkneri]AFX98549.1 peptide deformylase [Candidatus Endolissoclinum faulkneri L2]
MVINMPKQSIIWAPDPILKVNCTPVAFVDKEILTLMEDMLETMYDAPGIGLAAPQVGVTKRVIVLDVSKKDSQQAPLCLANPEIIWRSYDNITYEEGCLSLPDFYTDVKRSAAVKVRYVDRNGHKQEIHAKGLLAICLQHEIDHINGILLVDNISRLKRNIFFKKMIRVKKIIRKNTHSGTVTP